MDERLEEYSSLWGLCMPNRFWPLALWAVFSLLIPIGRHSIRKCRQRFPIGFEAAYDKPLGCRHVDLGSASFFEMTRHTWKLTGHRQAERQNRLESVCIDAMAYLTSVPLSALKFVMAFTPSSQGMEHRRSVAGLKGSVADREQQIR